MGLDMYAYSVKGNSKVGRTPEEIPADDVVENELFYWRKHPNLHGFMQQLYAKHSGDPDPTNFNVRPVELTLEDLQELEVLVQSDSLPPTAGFFFGMSDGSEKASDLDFIRKAREEIAKGNRVFYDSWW